MNLITVQEIIPKLINTVPLNPGTLNQIIVKISNFSSSILKRWGIYPYLPQSRNYSNQQRLKSVKKRSKEIKIKFENLIGRKLGEHLDDVVRSINHYNNETYFNLKNNGARDQK